MPATDSESVPGAHSCSRASPIGNAGSCQRSKVSAQRAMMARVKASARMRSVLSGRCGPCCSIEPSGKQRMEAGLTACGTSWNVRSPISRAAMLQPLTMRRPCPR